MTEQASDPFAKGSNRHYFWWADSAYIAPGLFFRHKRIIAWPFSVWWRYRKIYFQWPIKIKRVIK